MFKMIGARIVAFAPENGEGAGFSDTGLNDGGEGEAQPPESAKPEPTSGIKGGLFDRRTAPAEDKAADAPKDDTPADPDRPEGIPEKFWDSKSKAVKTEDLLKAYAKLEDAHGKLKRDKMGGDVPEDPAEYFKDGIELPPEVDRIGLEPDDPGLKAWGEVAKKYGIGKELAVNLARDMMASMNQHMPEPSDSTAEFEKLGDNAQATIEGVYTWIEGAERSGRLSEADVQVVNQLSSTADGIRFLAAMRAMTGEARIPVTPASGARGMSADQWGSEFKAAVAAKDYKRQDELMAIGEKIIPEGYRVPVDAEKVPEKSVAKR